MSGPLEHSFGLSVDTQALHPGQSFWPEIKIKLGQGENGVSSEKIDCDTALGNHMFLAEKDGKIFIFGGSSDFDAEYGECKKFYDELKIGKSSAKKAKMED